MFHFWSEDNKWLRNKKWSFIIKSSRVTFTRIFFLFDGNDCCEIFLYRPFFAQVRLNFSEKVKIASYSIFCERRPGLGRHFPNYKRLELSISSPRPWQPVLITPPPGCCWENVSSDCLSRLWSKIPCIIIRVFLLLLAWLWLVVCQHLTKHLQTFSHSLPRPSFPYVLLRLQ